MSLLPLLWLPFLLPSAPQDRLARPGGAQAGPARPELTHPPTVTLTSAPSILVDVGHDLVLVVDDPDGSPVDLRLLNPPAGMSFLPREDLATPATVRLRWIPQKFSMGWNHLVFEASDRVHTTRAVVSVEVHGMWGYDTGFLFADVNADGTLDMLANADDLETYGQETGAVHVWTDLALPPPAADVPELAPNAYLHSAEDADYDAIGHHPLFEVGQTTQLADFTGDGVLDVVALAGAADVSGGDRAAILVWDGSTPPSGSVSPVAVLHASEDAGLCMSRTQEFPLGSFGLRLHDVTGDGFLDVVAVSSNDPTYPQSENGTIYIWRGGPESTGECSPTANLVGPVPSEHLGGPHYQGHDVHFADVTGDGISDVIAGGATTVSDPGRVYVWAGGSTLTGAPLPTATLEVPGSASLGLGSLRSHGIHVADVIGDETLDVIAADGLLGVHAWQGGNTLTGTKPPNRSLLDAHVRESLLIADVTGDGRDDVLVGDALQDEGRGVVWVWIGGPLTNHARLEAAIRTSDDGLGGWVHAHDVTGDGVLDVVAEAPSYDDVVINAGAVFVWKGGTIPPGQTVTPSAALLVSGASENDYLGLGSTVQFADVTGDAQDDLIVTASRACVGTQTDAGALYVWEGGSGLQGDVTPRCVLTSPDPRTGDRLGGRFLLDPNRSFSYITSGDMVQVGDVTGDGVEDLVVGASLADVGTTTDAGAVFVWQGGQALTGAPPALASLTVPGAASGDQWSGARGQSIRLAEVTGDGALDVFVLGMYADVGGDTDSGGIAYWPGGAPLQGSPAPWVLAADVDDPFDSSRLGDGELGEAFFLVDVSGDGNLDVVAVAGHGTYYSTYYAHVWTTLPSGLPTTEPFRPNGFVFGCQLGG